MRLDALIVNAELSLFYCNMLRQLRALNPKANMDAALAPFFPNGFVSRYVAKAGNQPAWYTGGDNARRLFFIDGVTTQAQSDWFCSGYDNAQGPTLTTGFNQRLATAAAEVISVNASFRLDDPAEIDVVGYSMGGAIGTHLVRQLKIRNPARGVRLATFGAPRALARLDQTVLDAVPIVRWMTDADPIPLVPLRVEDFPALFLALGGRRALVIGSYVHTKGGIQLQADGTISVTELPTIAIANPVTSLASWFFVVEGEANNPHSLNTYSSRLLQFVGRQQPASALDVHVAPEEPVNQGHRREADAQIRRTETVIQNLSSIQNQTAPEVDRQVLFVARRFGRIWAVQLGDILFTYSGNKKRARHLARAGNDFLRSLPKQAVVDVQSLVDQLTNFFDAAVLPGGPVKPPINTSL